MGEGGKFAPRYGAGIWKDVPLETRYLEPKEILRNRDFASPFGLYVALVEMNADIQERRGWDIPPPIGRGLE